MLKRVVVALLLWPALALADDHAAKAKDPHAEAKPEAKPEVKAAAKPEAKPETKPELKPETKPEARTTASGAPARPPARPGESTEIAPSGPVDRLAEKLARDAASANKAKRATLGAPVDKANAPIDPEPAPPPLKMSALQDEARRRGADDESDRAALVKMAAEISAAREALRNETARLEALLFDAPSGSEAEGAKKQLSPMDAVAKTLRGMKPDQAAPILSRMDRKLAVDLLKRIPPVDGAKLLAALKPELAAELASAIAARGPRAEAKAEVKK